MFVNRNVHGRRNVVNAAIATIVGFALHAVSHRANANIALFAVMAPVIVSNAVENEDKLLIFS